MSQSKTKNRINFILLFIISLAVATVAALATHGGYEAVKNFNSEQLLMFTAPLGANWVFIFWMPFFVLLAMSFAVKKFRKQEKLNIRFYLLWIVVLFFSYSVIKNTYSTYLDNETKACVDGYFTTAKPGSVKRDKVAAYCKHVIEKSRPLATQCRKEKQQADCFKLKIQKILKCPDYKPLDVASFDKCFKQAGFK